MSQQPTELVNALNYAHALVESALRQHGYRNHKVTLVARDPAQPDNGLVMTSDDDEFLTLMNKAIGGDGVTMEVAYQTAEDVAEASQKAAQVTQAAVSAAAARESTDG